MSNKKKKVVTKKQDILDAYCAYVEDERRIPQLHDIKELGFTRKTIEYHFTNLTHLFEAAREHNPEPFEGIFTPGHFEESQLAAVRAQISKHKRFIITSAVADQPLDSEFYKSIQNYAKRNNALLLILPVAKDLLKLTPKLVDEVIVFGQVYLNSNLSICPIDVAATTVNPTTGMRRIGQRGMSIIMASPKQGLSMVPTGAMELPHAMISTGAITFPVYGEGRRALKKSNYVANYDHVMGAIIVEIVDSKRYHFRQVQADVDSSFCDFYTRYNPDGSINHQDLEVLVPGDLHCGSTDPLVKKGLMEILKEGRAKTVVIHDGFDGRSISHHSIGKTVELAQKARANQLSLQKELEEFAIELNDWTSNCEKVVIVKSNHDEVLSRMLQSGRYVEDPYNHRLACELAIDMIDGKDPLQTGTEKTGLLKHKNRIKWLERDEDFFASDGKTHLGHHGDQGASGARGNLQALEAIYGAGIFGHSHSSGQIRRGIFQTGTSTGFDLGYNEGGSAWIQTCAIGQSSIKKGGQLLVQLINFFDGDYRLHSKRRKKKAKYKRTR